ncbi:E3 ubiquitin-protein ligase SH3RF1 [Armadillidium vulgare]|nr:E3 ubiquitin-protein ligase SH3RF1 [Armadillidium vulgare]
MILDEHLLYLSHIQNLKACCHRPLYLRHLPSITWGANGAILLGLFISLVRSKLDYSCTFMARRLKSYLSLLDPIQNEGLRIATSDFGSSPKEFLEVKAGVIYLYRCVTPYPANSEYELELQVGDIVYIHKKRDDGWFKGTLQRTGKTGLFPSIFLFYFRSKNLLLITHSVRFSLSDSLVKLSLDFNICFKKKKHNYTLYHISVKKK